MFKIRETGCMNFYNGKQYTKDFMSGVLYAEKETAETIAKRINGEVYRIRG